MGYILIIFYIVLFIIFLLFISRCFAVLLSKLMSLILKKSITVDYVGFFSLRNVSISLDTGSLALDNIWISWRCFNSNQEYPMVLHIGEMSIRADLAHGQKVSSLAHEAKKPKKSQGSLVKNYIIPTIRRLVQILGLKIDSVTLMLLNATGTDSLLHISTSSISLSASADDDTVVSAKLSVSKFSFKLLKSIDQTVAREQAHVAEGSTSLALSLQADLINKRLLAVEVVVGEPTLRLHEGFLMTASPPRAPKPVEDVTNDSELPDPDPQLTPEQRATKFINKLPKEARFQMENVSIQIAFQSHNRLLHLSSECIAGTSSIDTEELVSCDKDNELFLPKASFNLNFTDITIKNNKGSSLFALSSFETAIGACDDGIYSGVAVDSCHFTYHEEEANFWFGMLRDYKTWYKLLEQDLAVQKIPKAGKLSYFISKFSLPVDADFDLQDFSITTVLPKLPKCSMIGSTIKLGFKVFIDRAFLLKRQQRNLSGVLQVDKLFCVLDGAMAPNTSLPPNKHVWGAPCAINSYTLEFQHTPDSLTLNGSLKNLQLESSLDLLKLLAHLAKVFYSDKQKSTARPSPPLAKVQISIKPRRDLKIDMKLEHFNFFICSDLEECLMLRLDSVSAIVDKSSSFTMEAFKFLKVKKIQKAIDCVTYSELPDSWIDVGKLVATHSSVNKIVNIEVNSKCSASWDTTSHMTIFHHVKKLTEFGSKIKEMLPKKTKSETLPSPSSDPSLIAETLIELSARNVQLFYSVSFKMRNSICIKSLRVETKAGSLKVTVPELCFGFEGHDLFNVKSVCMEKLIDDPQLLEERSNSKHLTAPSNKAWGLTIGSLEVDFPYQFDFAANHSAIINIVKWLKMLHFKKKQGEEPLYADFVLRVKSVIMRIHDDPFEVKMGDFFELMKDEYLESARRLDVLGSKVAELRQNHGELLSSNKISELYTSLAKKNVDIYLKRSQKLYATTPMRVALMTLTLDDLEVIILADPSMNGRKNIIDIMKEIDHSSVPPPDDMHFTTLWCRVVRGNVQHLDISLRDFPLRVMELTDWMWWGRLLGAEQAGALRAKRETVVEVGAPWTNTIVTRSMPALKFYHDLVADINSWDLAYGPCFEPTWGQVNICMNDLNKPSIDPSAPLPFWDKMRLLFHGRLIITVQRWNYLWLSTKDCYNTTEHLDWEFNDVYLDWTNAHFLFKGALDVYIRTASKYDDVRLLHIPKFRWEFGIEWITNGDVNDHHSVMPCAPDKVPEHSIKQVHDSYALFRSHNLNLKMNLDVKLNKKDGEEPDIPSILFYSSTMRWLQNFQAVVIRNVTRPTRRGNLFDNTKPRKPALSRMYKTVEFNAKFPQLQVNYWASGAKQRGIEMCLGKGSFTSKFNLQLSNPTDGLIHRHNADWNVNGMVFDVGESHAYLYTTAADNYQVGMPSKSASDRHHVASVEKVVYCRQSSSPSRSPSVEEIQEGVPLTPEGDQAEDAGNDKGFIHKLVVYEFRGSWTRFNRDAVLGMYDAYSTAQTLKHNLSTEALKGIKVETKGPQNRSHTPTTPSNSTTASSPATSSTPSPMSMLQGGHAANMLHQLLSETATKFMVFSEEISGSNEMLFGAQACTTDDVMRKNWLIEFVNSQVMLKGCELSGYVIVSAANAQVMHCRHWPAWRGRQLTSKTTWVGKLDSMQYFATVESPTSSNIENVLWLSKTYIERSMQQQAVDLTDIPDLVGSGESVGGVVSDTVGATRAGFHHDAVQLQRIISRCSCQFYYASYSEEIDPDVAAEPPPDKSENENEGGILKQDEAVDSFTLMHQDLDVCTNSAQYATIMDIINNLLLYVEPKRKEATEKLQRMRFHFQLRSEEDQKGPILSLQNKLRINLAELRRLEKELYGIHRQLEANQDDPTLLQQSMDVEEQVVDCKESLLTASHDLNVMVSVYKEIQLQRAMKLKIQSDQGVKVVRRVEMCFSLAKWKLTEQDGQLGMSYLEIRQFTYTRTSKNDDSGNHSMEIGWVTMNNLLPNEIYKDVLRPQDMGKTRQVTLRVICRGKPPVGGISVQEHFEVNVVPLTIQLTYNFFKRMMGFFFPGRSVDQEPGEDLQLKNRPDLDDDTESISSRVSKTSVRSGNSDDSTHPASTISSRDSFRIKKKQETRKTHSSDDIEKMKERAERNNTFFYIKIPPLPLCISYKGGKEKNIEDVHNLNILLPTQEYHNQTWTWLDLLMALKREYKQALLSQAIKEKLKFKLPVGKAEGPTGKESQADEDADKAKLLFGAKAPNIASNIEKPKKVLFGKPPKN
ncbi:bridge-like lipid transfer protein family member 2 [Antedon mediterranea]|uniref:bridge-like lipid transfer protein family member 2 n=1 Tax=Antedon mediterranea TaxID=105859 RepID=UPI003AF4A43D